MAIETHRKRGSYRAAVIRIGIGLICLGILLAVGIRYGEALLAVVGDRQALQVLVAQAGWWGPLLLIGLNALQIVVAPIPGYAMQLAAGFLFGPFWGGLWGGLGVLVGSTLAMALTRTYGRPLAERMVGSARLDRWQHTTHSDSILLWAVLLLGPTGDLPYFLAGLSRVSFARITLLTMMIRVPSTFVVAALGAGVIWMSWWQLVLLGIVLTTMLLAFMRYQVRAQDWFDRLARRWT